MSRHRFAGHIAVAAIALGLLSAYAARAYPSTGSGSDAARMQRCVDLGNIGAAAMTMRHDNVAVIDAIGRYPGDQLAQDLVMAAYDERFVIVSDMVRDDNIARFRNRVQMDCLKGRL